jgi:hypothetical protein
MLMLIVHVIWSKYSRGRVFLRLRILIFSFRQNKLQNRTNTRFYMIRNAINNGDQQYEIKSFLILICFLAI